jgi:hypothetical protein
VYVVTLPIEVPELHAGAVLPAAIAILYPLVVPPPEVQVSTKLDDVIELTFKAVGAGGAATALVTPLTVTADERLPDEFSAHKATAYVVLAASPVSE